MAIYVNNGIIGNNYKKWVKYRILTDDIETVYELKIDNNDSLYLDNTNSPEKNEELIDESTGVTYFLAIRDRDDQDNIYEPILYLDSYECVDMCETLYETNSLVKELKSIVVDIQLDSASDEQLEVTANGWKII